MTVPRTPFLPALAPPAEDASRRLSRAVARRTRRRLRRLSGRLRPFPATRRLRWLALDLSACLRALPAATRASLLHGPDLRGLLSQSETWTAIAELAATDSGGHGRRSSRTRTLLFERVARTEHLAALVPHGRADDGLPRRARRFALARLADLEGDAAALLLGARLACGVGTSRDRPLSLVAREDPEQGRPGWRVDLGAFVGTAGALGIEIRRWRAGRGTPGRERRRVVRATLRSGTLLVGDAHGGTPFPAAGSPLRFPAEPADEGGGPWGKAAAGSSRGAPRLVRRRLVPGTTILLAPALRSSARRLSVGADPAGLGARLARALRLVRLAWPAAHREILARTVMVVPVRETGLVSYSLAARPGVSFINVTGKSAIALADDLLHETAHHLLHDVQEVVRLLRRGPDTEETQAFDSPWRGTRRPLHGLLHGAYTFLFRAELFARLLAARRRLPGVLGPLLGHGGPAFLARELRRELALCGRAQRDLASAARAGLLTPDGRALVRALAAWRRRIAPPSTRRTRLLPARHTLIAAHGGTP